MNVDMIRLFDTSGDKKITATDVNEAFVDKFIGLGKAEQAEAWAKMTPAVQMALLEKLIAQVANPERDVPLRGLTSMEAVNTPAFDARTALNNIPADKTKVDLLLAAVKRSYNNNHIKNDFIDMLANIGTSLRTTKPAIFDLIQAAFIQQLEVKGATLYPYSPASKMNNALAGWGVPGF